MPLSSRVNESTIEIVKRKVYDRVVSTAVAAAVVVVVEMAS